MMPFGRGELCLTSSHQGHQGRRSKISGDSWKPHLFDRALPGFIGLFLWATSSDVWKPTSVLGLKPALISFLTPLNKPPKAPARFIKISTLNLHKLIVTICTTSVVNQLTPVQCQLSRLQ